MKLSEISKRLDALAMDKARDIPYPSITIEIERNDIGITAWDGHKLHEAKSIEGALTLLENLRVKPDADIED